MLQVSQVIGVVSMINSIHEFLRFLGVSFVKCDEWCVTVFGRWKRFEIGGVFFIRKRNRQNFLQLLVAFPHFVAGVLSYE
jgi:hypothetical protein